MANLYGVNYTAQDPVAAGDTSGALASNIDVAEWGGRVRVCFDSFTASGNTGNADVIHIGKIPSNATLLYGVLQHDNSNSSCTYAITVGATTMRAAATATVSVAHIFGAVAAGTKTTALSDVKVTLGSAALADTKFVKCMIYYTVD
tara:strand:+ start:1409 stop:1846 length:438 start_codon:yes stop_codon:yes gene_type:complete